MLVWKCAACGTQMAAGEADAGKSFSCTACGAATFAPAANQSPPPVPGYPPQSNNLFMVSPQMGAKPARCSRVAYILLGIFLGKFGVHNFVAGYVTQGFIQLGMTLVGVALAPCTLCASLILVLAVYIWAIVEIITTLNDADGVRMP